MTKRLAAKAMLLLALLTPASFARAGVYTDELSKCLVQSSSPQDQKDLVIWVFSAMSLHPDIQVYSSMTPAQHDDANKRAGALLQRLLTVDCHTQTVSALKYEGASAFESAFGVLGQVAMRGLMTDSQVSQGMGGISKYFDESKLQELGKEAGVTIGDKAPK